MDSPLLLYYPRRFRRRLLLPPGWVALGFLLLLGCLLLRAHWQRLQLANVVQLTMPLRPTRQHLGDASLFSLFSVRQQVEQVRYWQQLEFTGRPSDSLVARRIGPALIQLNARLQPRSGVAIRFAPATKYRYLIYVLDQLSQHGTQKYALDNYRAPAVLYVLHPRFAVKPLPYYEPLVLP